MEEISLKNKYDALPKDREIPKFIEARCQNCGKTVMIPMPFYGCVFCIDCMKGESYESADAPEFKQRFNSWIKR